MFENFLRRYFYKYRHNKYLRFLYYIPTILRTFFYPFFWRDFFLFKKNNKRFRLSFLDINPVLKEKTEKTGFDPHYIYHVAWAIRKVKYFSEKLGVKKHIDFSSSLYFCTNLAAILPVEFYDFRPASISLPNLASKQANLTDLVNFEDNSIESLSCLHVIEHIGLGRYGDPIDPDGDVKAIDELKRICKVGGNLLFVTPIGEEKIVFNAHRVYSFATILKLFGKKFSLQKFSLVTDNGEFLNHLDLSEAEEIAKKQSFGCGCFWFKKIN